MGKCLLAIAFVACLHVAACLTTQVEEVLKLLEKIESRSQAAVQKEKVAYAKYERFCKSSVEEMSWSRENALREVDRLQAEIGKKSLDAQALSASIVELEQGIQTWSERSDTATSNREQERANYQELFLELNTSMEAIDGALEAIRKESPKESNVEDMLKDLKVKTQAQRLEADQKEREAARNQELLVASLKMNVAQAKSSLAESKVAKDDLLKSISGKQGDLRVAQATEAEDLVKIHSLRSECMEKALDFEKKQALREEEMKALATAKQILLSDEVSGAHKRGKALMQLSSRPTSLAQFRRKQLAPVITTFLRRRASEVKSPVLALVVRQLDESRDPIENFIKMVEEMLPKLEREDQVSAESKAKCEKELSINNRTRHTKSALLEKLTSTVEENEAEIHSIRYEVKALEASLAAAQRELIAAEEIRQREKAQNEATISEAQNAQLAVSRAKEVLENVYAKASFLQENSDLATEMEAPGLQGGLTALLEVLVNDFTKLEADTSEAEETASQKYQEFKTEARKDAKVKELEIGHKESRKDELSTEILEAKKDLKVTQDELQAAKDYYEGLVLMCKVPKNAQEKEELRQREIAALKEALRLLK